MVPQGEESPSAAIGVVITVDRGRYRLVVADREVVANKARQLGRMGVIVGDRVRLHGDVTGEEGTRSILSAVECGYRLLDSAVNYKNEDAVGEAVRRAVHPG